MQYQLFVRSQSGSKFVASVFGIPNLTVEGKTEQEAIAGLWSKDIAVASGICKKK